MSEEHAYGHRTDFDIEFDNVTKRELWELYILARTAHAETKKRLEESEAKIKYLLERETELESQLNELNIERLTPFVLKSEMENMKSIMQIMIDERQERLEELESWVLTVVGGMLPPGVWFGTPLQKAIQNAEARKGEAMG